VRLHHYPWAEADADTGGPDTTVTTPPDPDTEAPEQQAATETEPPAAAPAPTADTAGAEAAGESSPSDDPPAASASDDATPAADPEVDPDAHAQMAAENAELKAAVEALKARADEAEAERFADLEARLAKQDGVLAKQRAEIRASKLAEWGVLEGFREDVPDGDPTSAEWAATVQKWIEKRPTAVRRAGDGPSAEEAAAHARKKTAEEKITAGAMTWGWDPKALLARLKGGRADA